MVFQNTFKHVFPSWNNIKNIACFFGGKTSRELFGLDPDWLDWRTQH